MRETRPSGSEGGGTELNRSSLPLSARESELPKRGCVKQTYGEHESRNLCALKELGEIQST